MHLQKGEAQSARDRTAQDLKGLGYHGSPVTYQSIAVTNEDM